MKNSLRPLRFAVPLALVVAACVQPMGHDATGGTTGSNAGGSSGSSGGATGSGAGGSTAAAGGQTGGGGTTGTGGGATGVGGRTATGGASGQGGASGLGGATPNPDAGLRPDLTGRKALFVVPDPGSLDEGDVFIQELLELRGVTVTYGALTTTPASMAASYNVLLLSSGIGSDSAAAVFKDVPIPVVAFTSGLYQTMGFVPNSSSRGSTSGSPSATITDTSTLMSSDLALGSTISVVNASLGNANYTWGIPGGTPIKVAAIAGTPTQFVVFGYEKGAAMAVGTAAARRVAIGWKASVEKLLTVDAFKLQDGAFSWTVGAP